MVRSQHGQVAEGQRPARGWGHTDDHGEQPPGCIRGTGGVITGHLRTRSHPRNSPTVYRVLVEVVLRAHQHHTVQGVPSLGDHRSVRRMAHDLPRVAEVPGRPVWCIGTQPLPPPVSGTWGNSPSRAGGGSVIEEITEDWLASAMHAPGRDRPSPTAQDAGNRVRRPYVADRVPPPARSAAGSRPRHRRTSGDSRRLAAAWNQAVAEARLLARRPGAAPLRRTRPPPRRYRSAQYTCALSP